MDHTAHGHHGIHDHELESAAELDVDTAKLMWELDNVRLKTVGIDIGSATSHVVFSEVVMRRQSQNYSSRFEVVSRETLYQSGIILTPYFSGDLIEVDSLREFVADVYRQAGLTMADVDAGAVILTGVAIERDNARAIAELFADSGGKFVCASAGHRLEALLAAHGSGSVELSRSSGTTVLNVDVGGGTTKLSLARDGAVIETLIVTGGGRLITWDESGAVERIERVGAEAASQLGIDLRPGIVLTAAQRYGIAEILGRRILAAIAGTAVRAHILAGALSGQAPDQIVLSGGVAQHMLSSAERDYLDLGTDMADVLREGLAKFGVPVSISAEPIRATVVGASQYSVQLSGNTVHVSGDVSLPVHNLPAVIVNAGEDDIASQELERLVASALDRLDLAGRSGPVALAVRWDGIPSYDNLAGLAGGLLAAHVASPRAQAELIIAVTSDVAQSVGRILAEELGWLDGLVVIDGVELSELDYVDLGELLQPANVIPVIVKSLLFEPTRTGQLTGLRARDSAGN